MFKWNWITNLSQTLVHSANVTVAVANMGLNQGPPVHSGDALPTELSKLDGIEAL